MDIIVFMKKHKRWIGLGVAILAVSLLVAACFCVQNIAARAGRRAFVEKLQIGYEKDIVLLPIYANLPDAILYQALILKGIQPHAWDTAGLIRRVLLANDPAREDLAGITGTNWVNIVAYDEWQECCLGAEAWRKAIRRQLENLDRSPDACVKRLQFWPPALIRLNRARIYSDEFLDAVVRALQRDAAGTRKFLERKDPKDGEKFQAACALYNAAACLNELKGTEAWRKSSAKAMLKFLEKHQAQDGTIDGDLQSTVETIASVMPPLAIAHRAGLPGVAPALAGRLQHLLEFLVYTLDMHGCIPFVTPTCEDANKREWLFWGSRIFQRPDFAWVAYGGFDMLEALPPSQTSKAFQDAGLFVMRNNWEIRRFNRRGTQFRVFDPRTKEFRATVREREFHNMSHTLWFDAKHGVIELFAFGRRQIRIRLPWQGLTDCSWQPGKDGDILTAKAGKAKLIIVHLPDIDAWALRLSGGDEKISLKVEPLGIRLVKAEGKNFIVTDPGRPAVIAHTFLHLRMKQFGALCLKTDGAFNESGDGAFVIMPQTPGESLTLALTGATGMWKELDGRNIPPITPALAIAGGDFALTADECVFRFHEHAEGKAEEKNRRQKRLKFDEASVSIQTFVLEDGQTGLGTAQK